MIRLRLSRITPLELWDLVMPNGSILWHHMDDPDFGRKLHAAISEVWHGTAASQSEGRVALEPQSFEAVHLTGGGAVNVMPDMREGPWGKTVLGSETTFGVVPGGMALLKQRGLDGWVIDVGQTALKLSCTVAGVRLQKQRDWERLPMRDDAEPVDVAAQRRLLREFLASSLRDLHDATQLWPAAMMAALPSRLDDHGVPQKCSYVGMNGDVTLLPDAMRMAGMPEAPLFVLNDAEMAAVSALQTSNILRPTLVLTLGFGVGGALIRGA